MRTPVDYYFRYQNITVPSPDGQGDLATGITVDRYRLGSQQAYVDERSRLIRKVRADLKIRRKEDPGAVISLRVSTPDGYQDHSFDNGEAEQLSALLRYAYVGKGSPESVQVALQLGAVDLPGSPPIVEPENFQAYCDKWLGLDCSGFVGNFLRHDYRGVAWADVNETDSEIKSNDLITEIWNKFDGTVRNSAEEIDPNDLNLLCMVDGDGKIVGGGSGPYGHIMISGPGERADVYNLKSQLGVADDVGVPAICVAESTGAVDPSDSKNGLVRSFYAYVDRAGQPGVFRMHRGFNGKPINVRVKGAPWTN
jgi:hypothetical protein